MTMKMGTLRAMAMPRCSRVVPAVKEEEEEDEEVSLAVFYCDVTIKLATHSTVDHTENKLKMKSKKKKN